MINKLLLVHWQTIAELPHTVTEGGVHLCKTLKAHRLLQGENGANNYPHTQALPPQ